MENLIQTQALRKYINSLQRQLQTKSNQQQTLYRALEASQQELSILDELYKAKTNLTKQVTCLRAQLEKIQNERGQMNEVVRQLQWAREQIARLNQLLFERSNMLSQAEDRLQDLYEQNEALGLSISNFEMKISQQLLEKVNLKERLEQKAQEIEQKIRQIDSLQDKLEALSYNYVKVEQAVREKDCLIRNFKLHIEELEEDLETLRQQMGQKNIMISCLQNELEQAKQTYRSQPQNELQNLLSSIQKIDLVKQNNYLVERLNCLQIENRGGFLNTSDKRKKLKSHLEEIRQQFQALSENLQL